MRRTCAGLLLLALTLPGRAVAGPPERPSGKMVFDPVADGLRKYEKEEDYDKRFRWLERLASTHDPRVAIALGKEATGFINPNMSRSCRLLYKHFVRRPVPLGKCEADVTYQWWKENEAGLRHRAAQLAR